MATYTTTGSTDDAGEVAATNVTSVTLDGTTVDAKIHGLNHIGFRFPSITVAQGATVSSAVLKFDLLNNYSGVGTVSTTTVYGEAADTSAAFAATGSNISGRSRTTASVAGSTLNDTNTQFQTTGITVTSIVQEIVNRAGWSSGNALAILFIGNGSSGNFVQPYMWDYFSGTYLARLTITTGAAATVRSGFAGFFH